MCIDYHSILWVVHFMKWKFFQYVIKKSLIYLVYRQNYSRTCLSGFSPDFIFISSLKMPGKGTVLSMDFISFFYGHCW